MTQDPERGPLVSIVIEWDNVRVSELSRARRMCHALFDQIHRLSEGRVIEVFFLSDALAIDPAQINQAIRESGAVLPAGVAMHVLASPGLRYYELKNEGVKRAAGEVVVFLDSDVVPEPDWLEQLLRSFRDPAVQLVGGNSYIEPVSLYSRAFALAWFFPLRTEGGPLHKASQFFANNLAGRREFLARYPFPDQSRFRGQCSILAERLAADGIPIYCNPSARVAHPPPNGMSHFVRRALCEGHDLIVREHDRGKAVPVNLRRNLRLSYWSLRAKAVHIRETIRNNRARVGLSPASVPYAVGIMFLYYTLHVVGEMLTRINPSIVRRRFPI